MSLASLDPVEGTTVRVLGTPAPQGSKNAFVHRHTGKAVMVEASSAKVKAWRTAVEEQWRLMRAPMILGAVVVHITFLLDRPKGHYRTGRNAHLLRDAAPLYPAVKPDVDKLARATLDALTRAGAYEDDARVVSLGVHKRYTRQGEDPGALVTVYPARI